MSTFSKPIALTAVLLFVAGLSTAPAPGSPTANTEVRNDPASPVRIDNCDTKYSVEHPNTPEALSNGVAAGRVWETATFTNVSPKMAVAVRFHFAYLDAIGDVRASLNESLDGKFSPGVHIGGRGGYGGLSIHEDSFWHSSFVRVRCSVDAVRFEDGTVWKAPPEGTKGGN